MTLKHTHQGFSLIEVAIVMVIIGFMLASLLGPLSNRMEQSRTETTAKQIDDIFEAIYGFAAINGRLPCPAILVPGLTFGTEDLNTGTGACNVTSGEPAWVTLTTNRFDAWGQTFVYRVDASFADNTLDGLTTNPTTFPATCTASTTASFSMCSVGNINITTGAGGIPANTQVAQNIPLVIVSLGKQKNAAATHADENENGPINAAIPISDDTNFVSRDFRPTDAPNPFNDIVRWIPTNVLIGRMVQAQRLP
jgi:prepilin-type N-terminal cleavage/methylation domain-containing protein